MRLLSCLALLLTTATMLWATQQPNIVLVITDDQGYGDLGYTGNPVIQTPNIDKLIGESVYLEDYHVGPTCSPTRCSLLTGRWTNRTGVWHTIQGRSMLRTNEVTLADYLQAAGYQTGIFGKWHLGDVYPYLPENRGFTHTYYHKAGGIGQTPDVWNNDYFDDQYHSNGQIVQAEGYTTDVFFDQAAQFALSCSDQGDPFFAYISTTAPHVPLSVPQKYLDMYKGKEGVSDQVAAFYGMITNIDENLGRFRSFLESEGLAENTIFIFTTDNGTATGHTFYNAGMRGKKGSEYEGGHRVPFTLRWPKYGLDQHLKISELTHMVDIVPTLLDLAEVGNSFGTKFDGVTLESLLSDASDSAPIDWENRVVFSDSQRVVDPVKWKQTSVMSGKWRLVNGDELYNIQHDPGQQVNVYQDFPTVVERLTQWYDQTWAELEPTYTQTTELYIGDPKSPVTNLNAHDWIQEAYPAWNQSMVRAAYGLEKPGQFHGYWAVKVIESGDYSITMSRWPVGSGLQLTQAVPAQPVVPGVGQNYSATDGVAIPIEQAVLKINGETIAQQPVSADDTHITFHTHLEAGSHQLSPYFIFGGDTPGEVGAYFCEVKPAE